jgi:hypothetical protein
MTPLYPPEYPDRPDAPLLTFGPSFSEEISRSIVQAVWRDNPEQPHEADVRVAAALTMLEAFHPRDHLECMLSAQAVAMHASIMECLRRAMHADTPEAVAIKLRANSVQLNRAFSLTLRDLERRQSKPLPDRPKAAPASPVPPAGPPANDPPPGDPTPVSDPFTGPAEFSELPEDIETRPDGTPGSLAAYTPKAPEEVFIPREPAIMVALATRPKPWRMVNTPKDQAIPPAEPASKEEPARAVPPPPVSRPEKFFSGDALARFTSARFDPNAPVEPLDFSGDDSVVELELISTGGDPEEEARRAAMIAAHPEGKPIVTFRYGGKKPPGEPPEDTR